MFTIDQKRGARLCGLILGIAGLLGASPVFAQFTVTPITWDVVGLDSNRPLTSGPELFPVGAEVCSVVATTGVTVDFVWPDGDGNGWDFGTGHPYINLRPGSLTTLSFASIGAGECVDAYFELKLNRSAAAFGQSREYLIQASDGVESASSPNSRAIHVEYLVSQNRNTTSQIRYGQQQDQSDWVVLGDGGGINLAIDQTYFIELTTQTSTAYEELQSFVTLSNTIFQVVSVSTTYSNLTAPPSRVPIPNPRLWADGCLWDSDLDSPNYLSCLADGKAGGVVVTTYEIRIISSGGDSVGLEALIYDRSGGSYHYNTDYSESPGSINTYDPTDSGLSKRFVPDTIGIGGTSRLRFTISNPNPIEVSGYNFIDNLPAGLEVASPPNAATTCGGIWNPLAADTALAFDGGTIVANGTCTILVDVTAAAAGNYDNISNNLFIGTTDTGNNATATLVVSATPPPVLECDDLATLALWQFPTGASATAPAPTSNLVTVSAAAGAGLTPTIETDTNDVGTGSWSSDFISQGPLVLGNDQYFEFVIDTTGLDTITLDFAARRTAQGAQSIQLYYGPTTGTETAGATYSLTASNTWMTFGPTAISTGLNPAGNTRFRLYSFNSGQNNNGHAIFIDGVSFRGLFCSEVPPPPPVPGVNPPEISKSFSSNPIGVGQQSTLTFVVSNPNPATALTGIAVSDQLPSGLAVVPGSFGGTCTGFWELDPSDSSVLLHSAGTLAGGASCTLTVDVLASSVGSALNISDLVYATESGYNFDLTTGVAQATLDVLAPPTIAKDFDPNLVLLGVTPGDAAILTFTITNPNPANAISGVSFTDTFPAGLVVATPPNASTSGCGTPVFVPAGGDGALSFSGGSIIAGGSCAVTVDVTGSAGVYPNTSSPVSHVVAGVPATNGQTASDTVQIDAPIPSLAFVKQVGPGSDPNGAWSNYLAVATGNPVYYKITVENTGEVPLTGITVTDPTVDTSGCTWPATLPVVDAAAPTAHIAECIIGPLTAIAGTNTNTASVATMEVPGPTTDTASYATAELALVKEASPLTYTSAGEIISYNFTVTNTGAAILAGPVVISDPLVPGASCPSLSTIGNNDNFFDPSEFIVCTGAYTTQASDVTNLSITNTAQASAGGFDSPADSATVTVPVAEPTIVKSFATDPVAVGNSSVLTITVTNNAVIGLTGVGFLDVLPAGLSYAGAPTGNTCGGAATVNAGLDTLTLTGGAIAAGGSCAVTVTVDGDVAGNYTNTTSVVSTNEVIGTTTGSDTLEVTITGPTIAKAFVDSLIGVGETTLLTITVTNTAATALSNVGFSDALPAGLLYAGAPSANTCGGTATVNAGNDTLTLAGGAIAASGSCSVTVDVTGVSAGNYTNTTSVVTSDEVNGTTTGSDTLQVEALPTIGKLFADDSLAPGDTTTLTITVTNNATIALTNASFVDQLPVTAAGELEFVAPVGGTCGGTPVISTTTGTNDTLTVTGFGLAAGASCTVTVDVQANAEGGYTNTTSVVSSTELTGTGTGTDNLDVGDLPTIAKGFAPDPINAGATSVLTITATNNAPFALTGITFSDTLPAGLLYSGAPISDTCGGTTTVNGGADTLSVTGGTIAADSSCTITIAVLGVAGGTHTNTTSVVDSTELTGTTTGSDTLGVAVPEPTIAKGFATDPIAVGGTSALTITVTNNSLIALTGVSFSDTLPAGLSFAAAVSANTCGGAATVNAGLDTLTLTGGAIAAGGSCTVMVTVNGDVIGNYSNTTSVVTSNEVIGTSTGSDTLEVTTVSITAPKTDVLLVDNDGDGVADPGDTIRYTITAANGGGVPATGVSFADTPDANTALVVGSVTTTQGAVTSGNTAGDITVGVSIGTLAAADSVTITFDVTVDSPFPAGTSSVANQGTVTADGGISVPTDDPDTGTADDPTVTPVEDPSVNVTKADVLAIDADGNGFPSPGDTLEYTVEISNTGNIDLTGITFSDTPDANTALVVGSVTTTQGTVTTGNTAGDTSVSVDVGTVVVGATATVTFRVTIDNPLPVGVTQVSNQGTVTTNETPDEPTDDPDTVPDDDPTNTTVTAAPVIDALKADALHIDADGSGGPSPGDTLRYTVVISNTGNTDATAVVFTDTIPTYTTVVAGSVTTTQGVVNTEDPVDVTIGDIAASATVTITFDVLIDDPLPGGVTQIANQGTVSSSNHGDVPTDDPDTPAVDDPTLTPVAAEPIIEASKTDILLVDADGSGDVSPGDTLSYTVAISNTGNTDATGVVFTDPIPANTSVVAGSVTTSQGTVDSEDPVQVTVGTIAPAATVNISFNVLIDNPLPAGVTEISNQGTVSSNEVPDEPTDDPDTVPDDDPTNTTVNGTPDLSIVKDDGGISTVPGGLIAYTLSYANNGNQAATGVVLTETVPASTIFNSGASTAGWACVPDNNAGSACSLAIGALVAGGSGSATFAVTVNNPVPVGFTQVLNTASVADDGANGVDPTPGNNTSNDTTPVNAAADVSATKADSLLIDNDGDGVADPGDTLRYTVAILNTGTTAATSVVFTDTPDANTTLVVGSVTTTQGSVTSGNTAGDTTVGVSIGTLAAAGSVTVTFDVTVDSPFPAGTSSVANQGTVTADGGISVPTDDPDTGAAGDPTVTPVEDPGVEVTKADVLAIDADGNGFPSPGDTLEYTVEISNTGNIDLTGITFSDTPDANTALVVGSVTTTQGTVTTGNTGGDSSVSVDVGNVAIGATATITFRVTIDNPLPVGVTQVSNQGTVTTNETPDEPTNDPDTVPDDDPTNTTVTAAPVLDAEKADALHIDADGNGIPSPGDTIRYTVVISNTGNTEATSVFFIDPIPTYTTVVVGSVTTTQGTVNTEDPVDVTIGDIAAGATVTITFDVLIDNPLPGGVTELSNQGTVSAGNHGDVPTDDPDTPAVDDPTLTPLIAAPVIEASKVDTLLIDADGSGDVSPGDTLSYSVTIDNTGNTEATGVVFTDPIPANTSVVAGSVTTSQGTVDSEDPVQVTVGTIVAGGSVTISFHVVIDNPLPAGVTEISNQGTVSSNEVPDEPTDDPDTVPDDDPTNTPVNSAPDLSIVKDDGGISTVPGGLIAYTLSYANNGNQTATGVTLTDTVPANTIFNSGGSTAGWVCIPDASAGSVCSLDIGTLAVGGTGSATFAVVVLNPVPVGFNLVVNNATIADDGANGADPTPGDNSSSDTTPVVVSSSPSLDALKSVELLTDPNGNNLADPGELLRYTVTVINDGDTVIENVVLRDTPDEITTLVIGSVATSHGTITVGNGAGDTSVEVVFGDLAVGQTVVVVFDVMINNPVPPGRTHISNQGVVGSDTIPDEPTNDPDTSPDDDPTLIRLGDPITGIPDLGGLGRLLFMLTLAMAGAALIRRRLI